ncbi:hypothetical protein CNMCM8057_008024 [Aspergillus fumigatus]|nr:hypothetical protein CNMCM8057_008024 [Aspergillus fumigatus]
MAVGLDGCRHGPPAASIRGDTQTPTHPSIYICAYAPASPPDICTEAGRARPAAASDGPRARDGASDQVPLRPKQRANLRGPLCRWFYVEGESRVTSGGVRALRRPLESRNHGWDGRLPPFLKRGPTEGTCAPPVTERRPAWQGRSGRRAASLVGSSRLSTGFGASSNGRARDPRDMRRAPVPGPLCAVLKNAREPTSLG